MSGIDKGQAMYESSRGKASPEPQDGPLSKLQVGALMSRSINGDRDARKRLEQHDQHLADQSQQRASYDA